MATPNIGISALADGKFQTTVGGGPVHAPADLNTAVMYAQRADKTLKRADIPVWRGYEPYGYTTVAEFETPHASMRSIERVSEIMPERVFDRLDDRKIAKYAAHYEVWSEKPTTAQLKRRYLHRTFEDYLRTLSPMQAGKAATYMKTRTSNGRTRVEQVDDWLYQGGEIRTDQDWVKQLTRSRENKMDGRQLAEFEKAQAEAGKKIYYWLRTPDGVSHPLNPTERAYVEWQLYTEPMFHLMAESVNPKTGESLGREPVLLTSSPVNEHDGYIIKSKQTPRPGTVYKLIPVNSAVSAGVVKGDRVRLVYRNEVVEGTVTHVRKRDGMLTVDISGQHSDEDLEMVDVRPAAVEVLT